MLKKEFRGQFLPCNIDWVAREALKSLRHTGVVRDYVKMFNSLMLDLRNMSEDDKLFDFMSILQPWAQTELRRQNVRDLPTAMAAAEGFGDYKFNASSTNHDNRKSKDKKKDQGDDPRAEGRNKNLKT